MNDYTLRELECFLAVAEELSFTRAAKRLNLAQPPLSRHIKNLEDKLEVSLFERSRRNVSLTAAGRAFREEAATILHQLRRAAEAARRAAAGETDRLEIGFVSAVLSSELVEVFATYRRENPNVRLILHDLLPADQLAALEKGELDLGFVGVAPEVVPSSLSITTWRDERLMVYLPADHPLAKRKRIRLSSLKDEPFVLVSPEAAPAYSLLVKRLCQEAGFRPAIVQEVMRAQAAAAMTVAGSGISILPESLNRITKNGVQLVDESGKRLSFAHSVARRKEGSIHIERFFEVLK